LKSTLLKVNSMTTASDPRQALLRTIDEAGWPMVAERVIRGICHDLNGRINSLMSLSYLLNSGSMKWDKVGPMVEEELKLAEELSRSLHALPDEKHGPTVLDLGDLTSKAIRLVRLQPGLEGVQWEVIIPPDFPGIRMDEALLLRCLVLLLTGLADEVKEMEGAGIDIQGRPDTRTLTFLPYRTRAGVESRPVPLGENTEVLGDSGLLLAGVVREMGGSLISGRGTGGSLVVELGLP
jgi:hypothetical protein